MCLGSRVIFDMHRKDRGWKQWRRFSQSISQVLGRHRYDEEDESGCIPILYLLESRNEIQYASHLLRNILFELVDSRDAVFCSSFVNLVGGRTS